MRKALYVAAIGIGLAGCGSSSPDEPSAVRKAVTDYFSAIKNGEAVKACQLTVDPKANCVTGVAVAAGLLKGATIKVGKPTVTGNNATVDATVLKTAHMQLK